MPGGEVLGRPELLRTRAGSVYRLAFRLTGDPRDAEALTREVLRRAARSAPTDRPTGLDGWLRRTTVRLYARRAGRPPRQRTPVDAPRRPAGDVQAELDALPPDLRVTVVLCDVEGLSYGDIAATLGTSPDTVRAQVHQARGQLVGLARRRPGGHSAPSSASSSPSSP